MVIDISTWLLMNLLEYTRVIQYENIHNSIDFSSDTPWKKKTHETAGWLLV